MTHQEEFQLSKKGHGDMHDITGRVGEVVGRSNSTAFGLARDARNVLRVCCWLGNLGMSFGK